MASTKTAGGGDSLPAGKVVLPGDVILDIGNLPPSSTLKLGPGLRQHQGKVVATHCGVLHFKKPLNYWVECSRKRAIAIQTEPAIGIVVSTGETHVVDIGTHCNASLSSIAFEGATKRNRPKIMVGDMIYARLKVANKDMEPELECFDPSTGKSGGYGVLTGGTMFECPTSLCRMLLRPDCYALQKFGEYASFEMAVGLNGRVWIKAATTQQTTFLANTLVKCEFMSKSLVDAAVQALAQFS